MYACKIVFCCRQTCLHEQHDLLEDSVWKLTFHNSLRQAVWSMQPSIMFLPNVICIRASTKWAGFNKKHVWRNIVSHTTSLCHSWCADAGGNAIVNMPAKHCIGNLGGSCSYLPCSAIAGADMLALWIRAAAARPRAGAYCNSHSRCNDPNMADKPHGCR